MRLSLYHNQELIGYLRIDESDFRNRERIRFYASPRTPFSTFSIEEYRCTEIKFNEATIEIFRPTNSPPYGILYGKLSVLRQIKNVTLFRK
jgi:hypothetical protein